MEKIDIKDINEEVTLSEDALNHVKGGAIYVKIPDIDGESRYTEREEKTPPYLTSRISR